MHKNDQNSLADNGCQMSGTSDIWATKNWESDIWVTWVGVEATRLGRLGNTPFGRRALACIHTMVQKNRTLRIFNNSVKIQPIFNVRFYASTIYTMASPQLFVVPPNALLACPVSTILVTYECNRQSRDTKCPMNSALKCNSVPAKCCPGKTPPFCCHTSPEPTILVSSNGTMPKHTKDVAQTSYLCFPNVCGPRG